MWNNLRDDCHLREETRGELLRLTVVVSKSVCVVRLVRPPGFEPGRLLALSRGDQKRGRLPSANIIHRSRPRPGYPGLYGWPSRLRPQPSDLSIRSRYKTLAGKSKETGEQWLIGE